MRSYSQVGGRRRRRRLVSSGGRGSRVLPSIDAGVLVMTVNFESHPMMMMMGQLKWENEK